MNILKFKYIFLEIISLIILSFFIGCAPSTNYKIPKEYTEDVYGKRKNLFSQYDTGKKLDKGSINISLTYLSNLN